MDFKETTLWRFQPLETMVTASGLNLRPGDILYSKPSIRQEPWSSSMSHDWSGIQIVEGSAIQVTFKAIENRSGKLSVSNVQSIPYDDFLTLLRG
jgi:hypothetical protein